MNPTDRNENGASQNPQIGFRVWLDRRTGLDSLLRTALDEPVPGGARFAYIFGSGLLFIFLSQVFTPMAPARWLSCYCCTYPRHIFTERIKAGANSSGFPGACFLDL